MNSLSYQWAITQEQQALSDGAAPADAAAGRELTARLFGPQPTVAGQPQRIHRNDIRLRVKLTATQANEVARLLLAAHPALVELRTAGQLQFISSGGQFRVVAVRGGVLPATIATADVQTLVDTVRAELPAEPAGEPTWYTNMRAANARRMR